jgi:uncharacterized membrane protein YjdF
VRSREPQMDDDGSTQPARSGPYAAVASLASIAFAAISWMARDEMAKYRYSFVSLIPIVWIAFALRRRLQLTLAHFTLFAIGLVLHDLGAFGGYQQSFAGLQFDWIVHTYFGVVGGLIVAHLLDRKFRVRGLALALLVVLVVTGIGGLHEIMEAASTMFLGREYGMLYVGADNPFDTQEDMLCNVIGSSAAVVFYLARTRRGRNDD